jgi:hypothetical protein
MPVESGGGEVPAPNSLGFPLVIAGLVPVGGVFRRRMSPRSRGSDLVALLFFLLAAVLSR